MDSKNRLSDKMNKKLILIVLGIVLLSLSVFADNMSNGDSIYNTNNNITLNITTPLSFDSLYDNDSGIIFINLSFTSDISIYTCSEVIMNETDSIYNSSEFPLDNWTCFELNSSFEECTSDLNGFRINTPNYCGLNESCSIWVDVSLDNDTTYDNFEVYFEGDGIFTEMSWNNNTQHWYLSLIEESIEQDYLFTIYIVADNISLSCSYDNYLYFREPFYVSLTFYKTNNTDTEIWKNDFHYAYMREVSLVKTYNSQLGDISYLEDAFSWMPFYGEIGNYEKLTKITDTVETFWSPYTDGEAIIKLYEAGNYSVGIIGLDRIGDFRWNYEFIKPQGDDVKYDTMIIGKLESLDINNETNQSYKVIMTAWEANMFGVIANIFKYILFGILWAIGVFFIFKADAKYAIPFTIFFWGLIKMVGLI